jgi:hypothetical protein
MTFLRNTSAARAAHSSATAFLTEHNFAQTHELQHIHPSGEAHAVVGRFTPLHVGWGGGAGGDAKRRSR